MPSQNPSVDPAALERGPLRRIWDGALPLPVAYWQYGVGGNMSFAFVLWRTARRPGSRLLPWLVYSASLAWFVLIFRGIWRSAGHYNGPAVWPVLARLGVLAGVVRMAGEAIVLARRR
jgi:hypothetical protein